MRGTVGVSSYATGSSRITPAHAGNREWGTWLEENVEDHPRACGEQIGEGYSPDRR